MIKYRDAQGKVRKVEGDLFVVKDVKGNDIFAGDRVISKDRLRKYEVTWSAIECNWFLRGLSTSWAVNPPGNWKDYTLIKDKANG